MPDKRGCPLRRGGTSRLARLHQTRTPAAWFPLAAGELCEPGGAVAEIAATHDATAGQVALAWLLARSPVMQPIPGTSSVEHVEENVAAAELELTADALAHLDQAGVES